ncbi:MAG: ACT domain-containing protein [Treponema sp.]|jgi:hypothetical protein|nr:ACT domain-containing protein [Treponema sp.]
MLLELLKGEYAVYQCNTQYALDKNRVEKEFLSLTKTKDEISIVASSKSIEPYEKIEDGWNILKIMGTLDFSLTGIISTISTILANENISVFVISTYNTDYIMIKKEAIEAAIEVLKKNGYEIKNEI